jgi:hypothetical protein
MTLRKREVTENCNRKHQIAVCGGLALERLWIGRKADSRIYGQYINSGIK